MRKLFSLFFAVIAMVAVTNAQDISSSIAPLYDGPNWGTISDTGITCSGGPNISIIRDDGSYENGYRSVSTGDSTTMVQKMVMPSIPFTLTQMCVVWTSLSPGGNITFDLIIYDTTGAGGTQPGNVVYRVNNVVANATGIFPAHTRYSYPINFATTQRAYFVGVRWNNNPILPQFFSADENGPVSTMGPGYQRVTTTYPPTWQDIAIPFPAWKSWGVRLEGISAPPNLPCNYTWSIQTSGTTALLYSVKAVSNSVCWSAGAGAVVRRTIDGGATWGNGNPNPGVITGDIYNIEALDANTAWVTTSPGATFIYKTINGGTTWTQVYTIAGGFINTIKMTSASNGYAFGDPLAGNWLMLKTIDGGSTWTTLATVAGTGDGRNNCLQVSLPHIWFGSGQNTLWHSTNSGINWTSATTTGITGQVTGIQFNTTSIGLLGGATMVKTIDGGLTFTPVTVLGTGTISGIEGRDNDYWYVRGTGIFRSTDVGATWTQVHTQTAAQNDISLINDGNGCMVGWSAGTTGTISKMNGIPVGINDPNNQIPSSYKLEQNYPNPFNPTTNITFALPISGNVELKIYDLVGREVTTLVNTYVNAGTHIVPFDASSLASGVYIYKINTGSFTDSKKMVLIK